MNTDSMLRSLILCCCVLLTTQACVSTEPGPVGDGNISDLKEVSLMESINNPVYKSDSIHFSAVSNGCTSSTNFVIEHAINDGRCELTIVRTQPDLCRKAKSIVNVELKWKVPTCDNGMDVVFMNPELGEIEQSFSRKIKTE